MEFFVRGINALKATSLLLGEAHWEVAAAPVRQLFELVVNVEHLGSLPDRDQAALRYATYGLLQTTLLERDHLLYNEKTGRSINSSRLSTIEAMLEEAFPMFRRVTSTGKITWAHSWCGKTTKQLARLSKNRLRPDQYDLLFRTWSTQAHGSPAAVIGTMQQRNAEAIRNADDRRVSETGTMAITLFIELWQALAHAPLLTDRDAHAWMKRVLAVAHAYGAPAPVSVRTKAASMGLET